jgi:peptidoglycan/xylan/chitin deacetylase (PgdA/CDA1 family)
MYHRIAEPEWDPWALAVSPRHFREHLELLRSSRTVLPLDRFADDLAGGRLAPDAVAISFDDGYRDNLLAARPLLAMFGAPATVFIATGWIGDETAFWWDELADTVLGTRCASGWLESCQIRVELPPMEVADSTGWRAESGASSARQALYLAAWQRLKAMEESPRRVAMAEVREVLGPVASQPEALPMARQEIDALTADGLVGIAPHTVHHPALADLEPERQRREIAESLAVCREIAGDGVRGFAYPYGDRSPRAIEAVRACGLRWACSTRAEAVKRSELFDLPRLQVLDWDGEALGAALRRTATG